MRAPARPLRVLATANDGLSLGHVVRSLAITRALRREGAARGIAMEIVMVTTSPAELSADHVALVRVPHPDAGRAGGLSDPTRRRIARACVDGVAEAFGPDLIVVDTFPSGPHGELAGLLEIEARRALVRRHVRADREGDPRITLGAERFDLVIAADDPGPYPLELASIPVARVPPIILASDPVLSRAEARAALAIPGDARAILVTCGGGGDREAVAHAERVAERVAEAEPDSVVLTARGPLAPPRRGAPVSGLGSARLGALLPAFDAAFAAAGYNTAHELAHAGVAFALYAEPRAFDDQAARRDRFAAKGLSFPLRGVDRASIDEALAWTRAAPKRRGLDAGGAARAASALLELVGVAA